MKRIGWLFFFALFFVIFPALASETGNVVTLRAMTEVNRPAIRLSDVFTNVPEGVDRDIAIAPSPGKSVAYDVRVLTRLAEKYRLKWHPLSLGERIILTRAAKRITQDMIRDAVVQKLKEQDITGKMDITFDNRSLEVNLPAEHSGEFELNNFTYDLQNRRFRADFMAKTDSSPVVLPVTGRVTVKREVAVLSKRLEAGTVVGEADVDWLLVPDTRLTSDMITDMTQLVGRELRRDTAEGQPIRSRDLLAPRLITRGSIVTLKVETPYLLVTAQGRALQDGSIGDTVRITNTQSNRVVTGTVESSGVVRVQTAQRVASVSRGTDKP